MSAYYLEQGVCNGLMTRRTSYPKDEIMTEPTSRYRYKLNSVIIV